MFIGGDGMKSQIQCGMLVVILSSFGCATAQPDTRPSSVAMIPDNIDHPRIIRVEIIGSPFPLGELVGDDLNRTASERLPLLMSRGIEPWVRERGFCPKGFRGPAIVWFHSSDRRKSIFDIECELYF
jgi:hypothetical protein